MTFNYFACNLQWICDDAIVQKKIFHFQPKFVYIMHKYSVLAVTTWWNQALLRCCVLLPCALCKRQIIEHIPFFILSFLYYNVISLILISSDSFHPFLFLLTYAHMLNKEKKSKKFAILIIISFLISYYTGKLLLCIYISE